MNQKKRKQPASESSFAGALRDTPREKRRHQTSTIPPLFHGHSSTLPTQYATAGGAGGHSPTSGSTPTSPMSPNPSPPPTDVLNTMPLLSPMPVNARRPQPELALATHRSSLARCGTRPSSIGSGGNSSFPLPGGVAQSSAAFDARQMLANNGGIPARVSLKSQQSMLVNGRRVLIGSKHDPASRPAISSAALHGVAPYVAPLPSATPTSPCRAPPLRVKLPHAALGFEIMALVLALAGRVDLRAKATW